MTGSRPPRVWADPLYRAGQWNGIAFVVFVWGGVRLVAHLVHGDAAFGELEPYVAWPLWVGILTLAFWMSARHRRRARA